MTWALEGAPDSALREARYDLLVATPTETIVEVRDLGEPRHRLVDELAELPAGATLFFVVDARLPDGTTLKSDTFVIVLD